MNPSLEERWGIGKTLTNGAPPPKPDAVPKMPKSHAIVYRREVSFFDIVNGYVESEKEAAAYDHQDELMSLDEFSFDDDNSLSSEMRYAAEAIEGWLDENCECHDL